MSSVEAIQWLSALPMGPAFSGLQWRVHCKRLEFVQFRQKTTNFVLIKNQLKPTASPEYNLYPFTLRVHQVQQVIMNAITTFAPPN